MRVALERLIRKVNALGIDPSSVSRIGDLQVANIVRRSRQGIGVDGKPFKKKKDGTRSTLHRTGRLLRSLTQATVVNVDGSISSKIVVKQPAAAYAPAVNRDRQFMGVSADEREVLARSIFDAIRSKVRNA